MDPFAGPGTNGITLDYCSGNGTTGANPGTGAVAGGSPPDPNRYLPTTFILPYEPPLNPLDMCPAVTATLKNEFASENDKSTSEDYTVTADMSVGVKDVWGLKVDGQMTWTSGETDSSTQDNTQSASLTLVCPSASYNGPTVFQVYWDKLFQTFVLVPFVPGTGDIVEQGKVVNAAGKPVVGEIVNFRFGDRIYHTVTTSKGTYKFFVLKGLRRSRAQNGTLLVRDKEIKISIPSKSPTTVRIQ
jgi:hypothetical protein